MDLLLQENVKILVQRATLLILAHENALRIVLLRNLVTPALIPVLIPVPPIITRIQCCDSAFTKRPPVDTSSVLIQSPHFA